MPIDFYLRELTSRPFFFVLIDHIFSSAILIGELPDFIYQTILIVTGAMQPKLVLLLVRLGHYGSDDLDIYLDTRRNIEMKAAEKQGKPSTYTYSANHVEYVARPGLAMTVARVRRNGLQKIV
jgi:hypothetical protein